MPELVSTVLPLFAILALFWLLVIRPTQNRNKALDRMRAALDPGDRVMLSAGIFGTLLGIEGDRARVEVAPGVTLEVATAAIATVVEPATAGEQGSEAGDVERRADPDGD